MVGVNKLEETIMELLREHKMNAFAQQLRESGMGVTTVLKTSSCLLRRRTCCLKRMWGGKKDLRSPACLEGHIVCSSLTLSRAEGLAVKLWKR